MNARDAMPEGGQLTLEVSNAEVDEAQAARCLGMTAGPHVTLAVRDIGVGMSEATLSHLFEPLFTTNAPGQATGLGLSTVARIVRQSGGGITVESTSGHETMFTHYFPRLEETPPGGEDRDRAPHLPGRGERPSDVW